MNLVADGLRNRNGPAAHRSADRLCRLHRPHARELLARCLSLDLLGRSEDSLADLDRALAADGSDLLVLRRAIGRDVETRTRVGAARAILSDVYAAEADVERALACLGECGEDLVVWAGRRGRSIAGWIAWSGPKQPALRWLGACSEGNLGLTDPQPATPTLRRAAFGFDRDPAQAVTIEARSADGSSAEVQVYADLPSSGLLPAWTRTADEPLVLNVIVPVYKDLAATQASLASLARQKPPFGLHLVIVDDRSPDPEIAELARHFCAAHGAVHVANRINLGFAGSVNTAIRHCVPGDLLLLNSDVVLGERTLERMALVAHREATIGTVMPFSNDSAATSFPIPNRGSPFPTPAEQREIDDAAWAAHGPSCIDLLTNIGFCLYIRKHCFLDVGFLSSDYDRGYYEDVEFCLKAAEKGYRNVAAIGLYVGHASGRSFEDRRALLVARNGSLVRKRFEGLTLKDSVAADADPLREARAAIEERLRPRRPVLLLVGRPARVGHVIEQRRQALSASGHDIVRLSWSGTGDRLAVTFEEADGHVPQSLAFRMDPDGERRLAAYLEKLAVGRIELAELGAVPEPVRRCLASLRCPPVVLVDSRELALESVASFGSHGPDETAPEILPLDAMARRFLAQARDPAGPPRARSVPGRPRLWPARRLRTVGLIVPLPRPSVDTLILGIARGLCREPATELIVFGSCVDDLQLMSCGNVHVTGRIGTDECVQAFGRHAVEALFSPYRTSAYGILAALAAAAGLPKGYFDWSGVPTRASPDDLVLEWDLPDDDAAFAFAQWCDPAQRPAHAVRAG